MAASWPSWITTTASISSRSSPYNGYRNDVFVRITGVTPGTTPTTYLASETAGTSSGGNLDSADPVVSRDGSTVAFDSQATGLPADPSALDPNATQNVYSFAVSTQALSLVSSGNGSTDLGASFGPSISDDGTEIAFTSSAGLTGTSNNGTPVDQVYLYDASNSANSGLTLVSSADGTTPGDGASDQPSISGDGGYLAYRSLAQNIDNVTRDRLTAERHAHVADFPVSRLGLFQSARHADPDGGRTDRERRDRQRPRAQPRRERLVGRGIPDFGRRTWATQTPGPTSNCWRPITTSRSTRT